MNILRENSASATQRSSFILFAIGFLLLLLQGCKQPETIIVDDAPKSAEPQTARQDTGDAVTSAQFRKLVIGENSSITTLDPLLAENSSTMRAIQLVYEGLVRLDANDRAVPAVARSWEVGADSLTYTFHLRNDAYYHDSRIFSTGKGRRVLAQDVRFIFRRMASRDVPPATARMFLNIEGFESYFREQRQIYNPAQRVVEEIEGIEVSNDSTVVITLTEKDPHLLQKLAAPQAVIYPPKAIANSDNRFEPVGSGPFVFSQQRADTMFIFTKNNSYRSGGDLPRLDRVDMIVRKNESHLLRGLIQGGIHLIPELGPVTAAGVMNSDGELASAYRNRFALNRNSNQFLYTLRYHPESRIARDSVEQILGMVDLERAFRDLPDNFVRFQIKPSSTRSLIDLRTNLSTTYTDDPYLRRLMDFATDSLNRYDKILHMSDIRIPTRKTDIYSTRDTGFYFGQQLEPETDPLVKFSADRAAIIHNRIRNLNFNDFPWWINLREVTIPGIDRL